MVRKSSVCLCLFGSFGLALLVTGCLLIHFLPQIIDKEIKDNVKISPHSASYKNWKSPKSPVYFQVWVFDVENHEAVKNGSSEPSVVQKGPYTYKESRMKYNITFHDSNGTVDYRESKTYVFVPEMSVGSENDSFYCVNIPLLTVLDMVKDSNILIRKAVESLITLTKEELFLNVTVGQILWGYDDTFLKDLAELVKTFGLSFHIPDRFGLFIDGNGTDDGVYEVFTGQKDVDRVGEIVSWKGQTHLDYWTSNSSNSINGSDGTMYGPTIDTNTTKYLFSSDVCRSLGLDFTEKVTNRGINMDRFVAPEILFANVTVNPSNEGFCTPNGTCLPSGLLNVSVCREGAPIVMSMPHFLGCDDDIIESVHGLHPNQEEHQSFLDIEPVTGVVMRVAKRLQINVHLKPIDQFTVTSKLRHQYLPVMWLNESALIDSKDANQFKSDVFGKIKMTDDIKYSLIAVGGFTMLAVIGVLVVMTFRRAPRYKRFGINGDESLDVVT